MGKASTICLSTLWVLGVRSASACLSALSLSHLHSPFQADEASPLCSALHKNTHQHSQGGPCSSTGSSCMLVGPTQWQCKSQDGMSGSPNAIKPVSVMIHYRDSSPLLRAGSVPMISA